FMRKISKLFALLTAIIMACAFIGCSDGNGNDNSNSQVVWTCTSGSLAGCTVTINNDNTVSISGSETGTGTCYGDPNSDGTITIIYGMNDIYLTITGNTATDSQGCHWTKQ
ncbi:MAG: hypothetical protein K6B17_04820, partial [Treponema sp.]|nr:hypothetical protein [Treponema sp.]